MADVITADEMRCLEKAAMASGSVTGLDLMERAGRGVVDAIFETWPEFRTGARKALILCGPGNNGGDGYVVARHLKEAGWQVTLRAFGDPDKLPPDALANFRRWSVLGETGVFEDGQVIEDEDLIVDALFGIGQTRALPEFMQSFAAHAALMTGIGEARLVAIDIPSGVESDSGAPLGEFQFFADLTVTFHCMKPCHIDEEGAKRAGQVVVRDIGL